MKAERIIMMVARMIMRGGLSKMGRGQTAAQAPDKKRLARQAMRMARRTGRF